MTAKVALFGHLLTVTSLNIVSSPSYSLNDRHHPMYDISAKCIEDLRFYIAEILFDMRKVRAHKCV